MSAKQEERFPVLAEIRDQVERDYMVERRQELKDITYRKLREGYEIIIELDALAVQVPFPKRLGQPEEYASFVMELVRNSYFNGQTIRLDGAVRLAPK